MIIAEWGDNLYITADGYPNTLQPFTLTSRKLRDLFDQIRDPWGDAVLNTVLIYNSRHRDNTYRTYLYQRQRRDRSVTFIEKYTTVSAAIAGHLRHCQALGF